jgi:hypothetical protein
MIIYKTTNLINGKFYIGKDKNNNKNYFGSGVAIRDSIKKYGKENFSKEILCVCTSIEELNEKEKYYINLYNSQDRNIGYNITNGGDGNSLSWNGDNLSESHKKNISEGLRKSIKFKEMWGGEEHRSKLRDSRLKSEKVRELINSEEWKNKISNSVKNSKKFKEAINSPERSKKISESMLNSESLKKSRSSEEFKKKCSEWQKGKKRSPEFLNKFRESRNKTIQIKNKEKSDKLRKILEENNFNISETSIKMNITTSSVYRLIKKFNLK